MEVPNYDIDHVIIVFLGFKIRPYIQWMALWKISKKYAELYLHKHGIKKVVDASFPSITT